MNEDGLVASMAFGGSAAQGRGFSKSSTVYTAVYRPAEGRVDYLWPKKLRAQRFDAFNPGEYSHDYGALTA